MPHDKAEASSKPAIQAEKPIDELIEQLQAEISRVEKLGEAPLTSERLKVLHATLTAAQNKLLETDVCEKCGKEKVDGFCPHDQAILDEIDQERVLSVVEDGLSAQFSGVYSYTDMLDDLELTDAERKWAAENITYKAYIIGAGQQ